MKLSFTIFSNGGIISNLEKWQKGYWNNGWHIGGESEMIAIGYHLFDTDFYNNELKPQKIIPLLKTADDLQFFYSIPKLNILYRELDGKGIRSGDMGLHSRNDMSIEEKLSYYNLHKNDSQKSYVYNCETDRDVALAELHFYITHGYKYTECQLCHKPFFTNNLKNQYCRRIGENPDYPKCSCNKARELMRNAKSAHRETAAIRKIIITTLRKYPTTEDKCNQFINNDYNYKNTHTDDEYTTWIYEQYNLYVPHGRKKPMQKKAPGH